MENIYDEILEEYKNKKLERVIKLHEKCLKEMNASALIGSMFASVDADDKVVANAVVKKLKKDGFHASIEESDEREGGYFIFCGLMINDEEKLAEELSLKLK